MPLIPPETIELIQSQNDIVEVIGSYIALKRAAGLYKAICPFHQERTPSFSVNPQRQIYKCFGCGAGGNVIRFVMTYESLDFIAAAKKLADRAGIRLIDTELSAEDSARMSLRRRLLALHAEAAEFFHHQLLRKPAAKIARDYLKNRGIGVEVAKAWKLGYAPESYDAFGRFAAQAGFAPEEILQSGIVSPRDEDAGGKPFFDRFRGRVMFPICNDSGDVIAFSGRILLSDAKSAKYINSPETMLFTKGAVLFGLHRSKRAIIDKSSAIVCEGQLDLITAFEAGIQNVIAPQGTAFTEKQAHLLKRIASEVILCFDSDLAGQKAAERSLPSLLAENLVVRVAEMPPGEDPDSLIRNQGAEAFLTQITGAKDYFDFQIEQLAKAPDFATPRGKLHAAKKLAESISLLTDGILRETVLQKATQRLEVSVKEFSRLLTGAKPRDSSRAPSRNAPEDSPRNTPPPAPLLDPTLRLLATAALCDDEARAWIFEEPWNEVLAREPDADLLVKILQADFQPSEQASVNAFLTTLPEAEEAAICGILEAKTPENTLAIAQDCWRALQRRHGARKIAALQARLRTPGAPEEDVLAWQKQILDLTRHLSDIARPFSPPR